MNVLEIFHILTLISSPACYFSSSNAVAFKNCNGEEKARNYLQMREDEERLREELRNKNTELAQEREEMHRSGQKKEVGVGFFRLSILKFEIEKKHGFRIRKMLSIL